VAGIAAARNDAKCARRKSQASGKKYGIQEDLQVTKQMKNAQSKSEIARMCKRRGNANAQFAV
jgi:hypothetical protein